MVVFSHKTKVPFTLFGLSFKHFAGFGGTGAPTDS